MGKIITAFFIVNAITISLFGQYKKDVLFIGNSYTASNNLPNIVSQMASSTGDTLFFDSNTPGGARFLTHSSNASSIAKIFSRNWDFVVLQAQSQEPSFGQNLMRTDLFPHAKILCDTIRVNNACTQPLFYNTWGRQNGDNSNCQFAPWVCTYQGMDSALAATYTNMAIWNSAELSPVGQVWNYIRQNHPTINLYSSDGSHPSLAGSYAAACTFYTMIFKKNPTNISWNSSLSTAVADSIKKAATLVAFDSIANYDFSTITANSNFTISQNFNLLNVQSISTFLDSVYWDFGDGNTSTSQNPTHTYSQTGQFLLQLTAYNCGRSSTSSQNISVSTLSINEQKNFDVEVFPNPVTDIMEIKSEREIEEVIVYSSIGVKLFTEQAQSKYLQLNLDKHKAGAYFLKFKTKDGSWQLKRFIKL